MTILDVSSCSLEPVINKPHSENRGGASFFKYNPKSQLLIGLMIALSSLSLSPVAEAARPRVIIDKIAPVEEGNLVTLNASNTFDVDGKALTYTWRQVQGPDVVINNPNAPIATFTAPTIEKTNSRTRPVRLRFELEADNGDDRLATASRRVPVRVLPVNNPPVANAGPNRTVSWEAASSGIDLDASGSTDDGQIIQYRWRSLTPRNQLPRGARVRLTNPRAERASFEFTSPDRASPVTLDFELFVRDNDRAIDRTTVSITVAEGLAPPVANAGSAQTVTSGASVTLNGAGSTGTIDSYAWEQTAGPSVTLSNPNSASAGFTAPTVATQTVLTFRLTAANSAGPSQATVNVTITPAATAPVANAGSAQTVTSGASVTLNGTGSTGTIDSYAWEQTAGPSVTLSNPNSASAGFTAPSVIEPTLLTFTLTTTNSAGSSQSTVNVTVNPILVAPVANAGSAQTVTSGASVTLNGAGSTGTIDSYAWEQTTGPSVTLSNPSSASAGFTAPTVATPTVLTFRLTTTNSAGSSSATVNVTVNPQASGNISATLEIDDVALNDPTVLLLSNIQGGSQPYTITVDWGDGEITGPVTLNSGVTNYNVEDFYYEEVGSYNITVTIRDASNQTTILTENITVAESAECN
ncbi:PKD domain-containing protein [Methylotuvimicrobium buryatense]|uniref:PKD/Chitinase domain-containing protein n=1 Tax=Methylotuvimicrobium buryatense TaxID=95641 RepID=A0A4V1IJK7_METBY|nr:hypothetical protein [Methylotuvimicrobium buryatense]QCW81745.1 hypothetical protein EQU24_05395 [Methylotuvimicrobium buryatense]